MPETTYLHIQGSETDATRVIGLSGGAVRVGRGAFCEVRLPEPSLADVQCLLRRRGEAWQVQPVGPTGLVTIGGTPVDQTRPLPMGVPIQVGAYRLVLRPDDWGSFEAPYEILANPPADREAAPESAGPVETVDSPPAPPAEVEVEVEVDGMSRQARLDQREKWLQGRQEERRWEARWKAVGEGLRSRSVPSAPPRRSSQPSAAAGRPAVPDVPGRARPAPAAPRIPRRIELDDESLPPLAPIDGPEQTPAPPAPLDEPSPRLATASTVDDHPPGSVTAEPDARPGSPAPFFTDARPVSTVFWHDSAYEAIEESRPSTPEGRRPEPALRPADRGAARRDEFASAASIFAAQGTRAVTEPAPATRIRADSRPTPTDPRAPDEWAIPSRFAGPPASVVALGVIGVGLLLGLCWTKDNLDAGVAARASLRDEKGSPVPIDPSEHPDARWWRTTAGHVAHWAAAIERSPESAERSAEVRDILDAARRASPLQAEVRLALVGYPTGDEAPDPSRSLGLSRDVVSLALAGRALKRAGKVEPALRAYRKALELAAGADPSRLPSPTFDDDPRVRRYRLPREAMVAAVVREMDGAGGWDFAEWSRALPPLAVVRLAAGRVLREGESPDADRAFELALADDLAIPADPDRAAEHHAAQAEALAFKDRKPEAAGRYRLAIGLTPDGLTRRRWQLALAEILVALGGSKERADLLESAKGADPTEEITRKAVESQRFSGLK